MRTPKRFKQRMYYALPTGVAPEYEKDQWGRIVTRTVNGKTIQVKKGVKTTYATPVKFFNSITSDLSADDLTSFGADNSGKKAKMTYRFNEYPFKAGTLIWLHSEVKYKDGELDPTSADYQIVGIKDTGLLFWNALLSEVVKGEQKD